MNTKLAGGLLTLCLGLTLSAPLVAQTKPALPNSFPWSRSRQQDKAGYYDQPAGLCEDYPEADRTQAKLDRDFQAVRWAGARLLRVGIGWDSIEREPGQYDWSFWDRLVAAATRSHVTLIPYVCYTPKWAAAQKEYSWKRPPADPSRFSAFMQVIAARYRGRVHSWEIWNEPDNPDFWLGSAADYARLVQAGTRGVHLGDPGAIVVLGGLADSDSDFGRTLFHQYKIGREVNAVNFHGYNETWNRKPLEDYPRAAARLSHEMETSPDRETSAPKPDLWFAEFGYSNLHPPPGGASGEARNAYDYQHTADYQAAALFKSHVLALSTGRLSLTAWYRINDLSPETQVIGDSENRYLGVMSVQGHPKPALAALRFYNRLFGQPVRCLDDAVRLTLPAKSQGVLHIFQQKNGKIVVVGWLRVPPFKEAPNAVEDAHDLRSEEVSVTLPPGVNRFIAAYDLSGSQVSTSARLTGRTLTHVFLHAAQPFIATVSLSQTSK